MIVLWLDDRFILVAGAAGFKIDEYLFVILLNTCRTSKLVDRGNH